MCSCLGESKNLQKVNKGETIEKTARYHFLEDNGTKIYLPSDFERVSLTEYQKLLKSSSTKKEYKFETERINALSEMDGALYIYFDKNTKSTYTINTRPYLKFDKNDASQILGLITSNNHKVSKNSGAKFERITAKYGGNTNQQLFKAIYKVSPKRVKNDVFNSSYIISSNEKTVFIQLTTDTETDFDPYIEKMLL
jgi:hypothetical protein